MCLREQTLTIDAQAVLRQIVGWVEDYNEIHPHLALRMPSPREFIKAHSQ